MALKKRAFILPLLACFALGAATTGPAGRSPDVDIRDAAEAQKILPENVAVRKLATGMGFVEGPVWFRAKSPDRPGYLIFSDIPGNELKLWTEADGLKTFRKPSHAANGNTQDAQGRLVTCEQWARCLTRREPDGTVVTLVDNYQGKKFNSPNDVAIKSDGTIWFTDPPYWVPSGEKRELARQLVFRVDFPKVAATGPSTSPATGPAPAAALGTATMVAEDFEMPNGICFSPDEKKLYISDTGGPHHVRVFDVQPDNTLANGRVFAVIDKGAPDGIRVDSDGRLYAACGDGVHIFTPEGKLILKILVPETPANCTFGGPDGRTLFMTARNSLYAVGLRTKAP